MRIGIDARPLQGETQFRGIGKAFESLLKAIQQMPLKEHRFIFYIDADVPVPQLLKGFREAKFITIPPVRLGQRRYFRSFMTSHMSPRPSREEVDVFLQYDANLGVPTSVPCVTVFHDLIPLLFRDAEKQEPATGLRKYKNALAGKLYWRKYLQTLKQYKRAVAIIAISNASKQDYLQHVDTRATNSVVVIYHGADDYQAPGKASQTVQRLTTKPYLLYVGGIDFRKNVVGLLQTFYDLKPDFPELRLITVGKEFNLDDQLGDRGWFKLLHSQPDYAQDVIAPGFVNDADLAHLYARAQAFVFPSRYEGFGLPVLEAMQAGCPVVSYANSSIPEVAGEAALLVKDGESLVPAIRKLLNDKELRGQLIAKGKQQAKQFSWEETAKKTLTVLKEAGNSA